MLTNLSKPYDFALKVLDRLTADYAQRFDTLTANRDNMRDNARPIDDPNFDFSEFFYIESGRPAPSGIVCLSKDTPKTKFASLTKAFFGRSHFDVPRS